jgi:hypothetical protein
MYPSYPCNSLKYSRRKPTSCNSSRDDSDTVGYIHNPARKIEASVGESKIDKNKDANNEDDEHVAPDVYKTNASLESDQDIFDDNSVDNVLQELKIKTQKPDDLRRNKELKRWIRNCRLECIQRAHKTIEKHSQK